jgi:hypothetical protein
MVSGGTPVPSLPAARDRVSYVYTTHRLSERQHARQFTQIFHKNIVINGLTDDTLVN